MSTTTSTILLAEEHDATRAFLADNLTADGYRVLLAPDRAKAIALLSTDDPDLILVDVNGATLQFVDAVRSGEGLTGRVDPDTPLIVLSRDADRLQRIRVLERGGDDVVRKPFAYPELRARIAAVLRRSELRRQARVLRAGPIVIDVRSREVRVFDRPVELSAKEYDLLVTLAGEPTRVFTRAELLRGIWGLQTFGHTRTLDSHVISSTVLGVGCVGCGFCPGRRRRFISSGVDSALGAELSPEGEATCRGRCAPVRPPSRHDRPSIAFLSYRASGRVVGWAGGVDGAGRGWLGGWAGVGVLAVFASDRALAEHGARLRA
jgi:DNA-binding response OmpR family regulator